jgi:hypothetical protein
MGQRARGVDGALTIRSAAGRTHVEARVPALPPPQDRGLANGAATQ